MRRGAAHDPTQEDREIRSLAAAAALALLPTPAQAHDDGRCHSRPCVIRVIARWHAREMARYRAAPMPYCTWGPESSWDPATGASFAGRPWAFGRYRVVNPTSGAGGKYQMLPSTYHAVGGIGAPHLAPPVVQERIARRVLRVQGLRAWVNC